MNGTFLYVAALYFGGVWMWRRFASAIPWRVAGLFYLLTFVFLFSTLALKRTGIPADHLHTFFPLLGTEKVVEIGNRHMNDVVMQMVPWAHQVRESWKRGEAPLWNAAAGGGYPLLANGQSAALSPLRFLSLPLDLANSFACEAALKLLAALTFGYLFMRHRGRSEIGSIVTAVSYGFCAFLAIWLHFPHATVAAFVPAMFYAIDLLIAGPSIRRIAFAGTIFATMLVGGHPETAGHAALLGGPYALFQLVATPAGWRARIRAALMIFAAAGVALLLALPFVLPFIEALPQSQRYDALRAQPHPVAPLNLNALVTFFHPSFLAPGRESKMGGSAEVLCGFAGVLAVVGWFAVLYHTVRHRQWRSSAFFFVLAALFFLGVLMGWRGFADIVHNLPLFELAANGRLRFAVAWCLAVLAGEAIDLLVQRSDRAPLLVGIAATSLAMVIAFAFLIPPEVNRSALYFFTLPRLAVLLVALLFAIRPRPQLLAGALLAATLLDLWSFGRRWYPPVPSRYVFGDAPLLSELRRLAAEKESGELVPYRVAATASTLFPNSAAAYGLQDIRAHDPMAYSRFLGALRVYTGYTTHEYFAMLHKIDDPFLDFLNVRYIATGPWEDYRSDRFIQLYHGEDGRIYENRDVLPRFYAARNVFVEFDDARRMQRVMEHRDWANSVVLKYIPTQIVNTVGDDLLNPRPANAPMASVNILSARAREFMLLVDAPRWTLITGSHPSWPGWRVYRGDQRLHTFEVNEAFLGFVVPPGRSTIRIVYVPQSFFVGSYVALLTALALIVSILRSRRRKA